MSDSTYGGTLPPLPPATTTSYVPEHGYQQPDQGLAFTGANLAFVLIVALVALVGGLALWYASKRGDNA